MSLLQKRQLQLLLLLPLRHLLQLVCRVCQHVRCHRSRTHLPLHPRQRLLPRLRQPLPASLVPLLVAPRVQQQPQQQRFLSLLLVLHLTTCALILPYYQVGSQLVKSYSLKRWLLMLLLQ